MQALSLQVRAVFHDRTAKYGRGCLVWLIDSAETGKKRSDSIRHGTSDGVRSSTLIMTNGEAELQKRTVIPLRIGLPGFKFHSLAWGVGFLSLSCFREPHWPAIGQLSCIATLGLAVALIGRNLDTGEAFVLIPIKVHSRLLASFAKRVSIKWIIQHADLTKPDAAVPLRPHPPRASLSKRY
jgi:hypothetical protein